MPLSSDASVEAILEDIPFFSVGLLSFGMFTFFAVMRAIDRWITCLHISVFLAFVASILDLAHNLAKETSPTKRPTDPIITRGLSTAREILFSFSYALIFVYIWGLVAQPPPKERKTQPGKLHSGSWAVWGGAGLILKWSLGISCAAIAVLQILYRVVDSVHHFGPVYEVECTIRIVVSAVFILKLLLNTYLVVLNTSARNMKWLMLRDYLPSAIAIGLGGAVAIGDITQFMFSETVLGSFLQAVEIYILIINTAVMTFRPLQGALEELGPRSLNRSSSFHGLRPATQRQSFLQILPVPPPSTSPDFLSLSGGRRGSSYSEGPRLSEDTVIRPVLQDTRRGSAASRFSSWLLPSRKSMRAPVSMDNPDADPLWKQDVAERGLSSHSRSDSAQEVEISVSRASLEQSPMGPKESAKWQDPVYASVLADPISKIEQLAVAAAQSSPTLSLLAVPARIHARSESPLSGSDSPIYGLDGVVRPVFSTSPGPEVRAVSPALSGETISRRTSISHLLREQAELDKSIATLRLLSRPDDPEGEDVAKPPSTAQSEFSLSNFPEPPWGRSSNSIDSILGRVPTITAERPESTTAQTWQDPSRQLSPSWELVPPKIPADTHESHVRRPSVPSSEGDPIEMGRQGRVDSAGTRYEITSFIGGMSPPSVFS
ncbi:hypothetical protein K474DRAFT_1673246 [Panus rudis PR-1116 ss-1]|nr:hypothetical protein K474DRAFT_1673246 [Panus rudis PR-1116 ss-1]